MMMDRRNRNIIVGCIVGAAVLVGMFNFNSNTSLFEESTQVRSSQLAIGGQRRPLKIPASLDPEAQRRLSLSLGNGECEWQAPDYVVPNNIAFYKTLIAGFPSCDKRMTFTQMEALTGWAALDEWDYLYNQGGNNPFIKSNYPHHEGYWSWGTEIDQVVMVVRNIRRTMVEYHDILWDIASAKTTPGLDAVDVLYKFRPPIDSFFTWRDLRVIDEIQWYGWFIDYWMENGLRRDIFTHKLTTPTHWPYAPPVSIPPECLNTTLFPWHKHITEPNTCTNNGEYNVPTANPTTSPTPSPSASPTTSPTTSPSLHDKKLKAFISSDAYQGDLGGVEGADLKCQALATNANLSGTYKAWLSNKNGTSPANSFMRAGTPYYLVDESTVVVQQWDDLVDGTLLQPIIMTENGTVLDFGDVNNTITYGVWTATSETGFNQYFDNPLNSTSGMCEDFSGVNGTSIGEWMTNNTNLTGTFGDPANPNVGAWTLFSTDSCAEEKHLYCFEQNDYNYVPPLPAEAQPLVPAPTPPVPGTAAPTDPYLFSSYQDCCNTEFGDEACYLVDICPTPAPTPPILETYDPHCDPDNNQISNGCEPVAVISAEKLRDEVDGKAETTAIAKTLENHTGISEYVIDSEAYDCIWTELIENGKGNRMVQDREGYVEEDYNFSQEMLEAMIVELTRLIEKYNGPSWSSKATANRLVELLTEHKDLIQIELDDVIAGRRTLTERDFLGPDERERRRRLKAESEGVPIEDFSLQEKKKHFEYFIALEEKVKTARRLERASEREQQRKLAAEEKKN